MNKPPLSTCAKAYIASIITAGLLVTLLSVFELFLHPTSPQWLLLAALTFLTGSFSVKIPSVAARISVSEAFTFASVLLFGPAAATVTVALDSFVMSLWIRRDARTPLRSIFNLSAVALSIWLAANAFFSLTGVQPGNLDQLLPVERYVWQLFALAALYFLLNSWFVAIALSFERNIKTATLWWDTFPWFSLNYFGGVSVAALVVSYRRSVDLNTIGIILPLLLISYVTYRTSLGRINDSKRHVDQVNELYMSTIETLAMAVDAKDQITHGHIRRVQVFATELAKRLGVTDERQLKAVEVAALLHDMGKLAIPEHILNKPNKLTPAEFDRMKQHSDLGADLLSSIRFPYPVVPIVRHHHENWNGTGYPSGIALGTDIPLGARILSVVDCFDALTSDRPYRPRVGTTDAFDLIRERRGTMYDPLVVDAFIRAYEEIAPDAIRAGQDARSMFSVDAPRQVPPSLSAPLKRIRARASEASSLIEFGRNIAQAETVNEALQIAASCLRALAPSTVFVFYRYDPAADVFVSDRSVGDPHSLLEGFAVRNGERVTGWCGANRKMCLNSVASLDLGATADLFDPPLRSAVSAPLAKNETLFGVLTAYSVKEEAFIEAHRYSFEQVATWLGEAISRLSISRSLVSFRGSTKA